MKVAIVNNAGFCIGGTTTICLQYAKLGFDVYFKQQMRSNFYALALYDNVKAYSTTDELVEFLRDYDRILTISLWIEKTRPDNVLDDLLKLRKELPNLEICHIHCDRHIENWSNFLDFCNSHNFKFDHVFSLHPVMTKYPNSTVMDINAFIVPKVDAVDISKRERIIFSAGRFEGFKGTIRFFNSVDESFFGELSGFSYVHEGAAYSFHKNDSGVSCSLQTLSLFDIAKHPKQLRPGFVFKHYGERPDINKFNVFPPYCLDDIVDRWKYYYVGICFLLGTKSAYVKKQTLFGDDFIIKDARERRIIEKAIGNWNNSLEYADMEKIAVGIPVLFSRTYADIINFTDDRLIYENFNDIPKKVNQLGIYYNEARIGQYNWLVSKVSQTNDLVAKEFTKPV